jgi:hypothetical protein
MTTQTWSFLAVAGTAFVLLGLGLISCITSLIRGNRRDFLASAPLVSKQEMTLASQGEVVVAIETPRTAADFRDFQIELMEKQTGQAATMRYSFLTAQEAVYGVTTMTVPFGRMTARPGVYIIQIFGLRSGQDYSRYRLILSRPYLGRMALQIVGIVLCGVGMLLILIWTAWLAGLIKPAH